MQPASQELMRVEEEERPRDNLELLVKSVKVVQAAL